MPRQLTFIGAGNMSGAIIAGLLDSGYGAENITATSPDQPMLDKVASDFSIHTTRNNREAVQAADVVVLAVKPQIIQLVCEDLSATLSAREQKPLVISLAAGISVTALSRWLGAEVPVIRSMPNTPALIGCGATGLYAGRDVSEQHQGLAQALLESVGLVQWVDDESLLDVVTAVSGSAPAYFFMVFEAMQAEAEAMGLPADVARSLILQTGLGAARMAQSSSEPVDELRRRVMSPNGTTERAVQRFQQDGLEALVAQAMRACVDRAREMQQELCS